MRTTLLSTALPNVDSGSGASITLAVIADALRDRGHEVSLCPVVFPEYSTPDGADQEAQLAYASSLGYEVEPVISAAWQPGSPARTLGARLHRAWRPAPEELYPTLRDAPVVRVAVERLRPEAVLAYGFEALAASVEIAAPRFAATSDPPHLALRVRTWRRWREQRRPVRMVREAVALQSALRAHPRVALDLLRGCDAVGAFGGHHAEWLRRLGVDCGYYHTPIADPGEPEQQRDNDPLRVLLVGHLRGTATLDGFRIFQKMLPHLERGLAARQFEVRVVGGYDPPPELARVLEHPSVRLVGFVADVDEEFRAADVVLVPVSIKLGVRVRILTAFAFGKCIVAHDANALGIPELAHDENALLGGSPAELAQRVLDALADAELRARLGAGARRTYERFFTPAHAGVELGETLERLAGQRAATSA